MNRFPLAFKGNEVKMLEFTPSAVKSMAGHALGSVAMLLTAYSVIPGTTLPFETEISVEDEADIDGNNTRQQPVIDPDTGRMVRVEIDDTDPVSEYATKIIPSTEYMGDAQIAAAMADQEVARLEAAGYSGINVTVYNHDAELDITINTLQANIVGNPNYSNVTDYALRLYTPSSDEGSTLNTDISQAMTKAGFNGPNTVIGLTAQGYAELNNLAQDSQFTSLLSMSNQETGMAEFEDRVRETSAWPEELDQDSLVITGRRFSDPGDKGQACGVEGIDQTESYYLPDSGELPNPAVGLLGTALYGALAIKFVTRRRQVAGINAPSEQTYEAVKNGQATTVQKLEMLRFRKVEETSNSVDKTERAAAARFILRSVSSTLFIPGLLTGAYVYLETADNMPEIRAYAADMQIPEECDPDGLVFVYNQNTSGLVDVLVEDTTDLPAPVQARLEDSNN